MIKPSCLPIWSHHAHAHHRRLVHIISSDTRHVSLASKGKKKTARIGWLGRFGNIWEYNIHPETRGSSKQSLNSTIMDASAPRPWPLPCTVSVPTSRHPPLPNSAALLAGKPCGRDHSRPSANKTRGHGRAPGATQRDLPNTIPCHTLRHRCKTGSTMLDPTKTKELPTTSESLNPFQTL